MYPQIVSECVLTQIHMHMIVKITISSGGSSKQYLFTSLGAF